MTRDVHPCPACDLKFWYRTELEDHLRRDHPDQADLVDHDLYPAERPEAEPTG